MIHIIKISLELLGFLFSYKKTNSVHMLSSFL